MDTQLTTQSQDAKIAFGDFETKGKFGIWLLSGEKKYVLFPTQLVSMLLHNKGNLTASCKDGEIWNGNTVYYYDIGDDCSWILSDYADRKAAYLVFPKEEMHDTIRKVFKQLHDALIHGCNTIYQDRSVNVRTMETNMKVLEQAMLISKNKPYGYESKVREQKLTFDCKHESTDFPYTLTLGGISLKSYVSDWTTVLTQLRKDLEMAREIRLFFEDSPTIISFPNNYDKEEPCIYGRKKELVEITPNEFCDEIVIFGVCYRYQVIEAIYEGLLRMARYEFEEERGYGTWDNMDNMTFYNKIKAPIIEGFIRNRDFDNQYVEKRQVLIKHIITICPHRTSIFKDEKNNCGNFFENGKVVVEFDDTGRVETEINGYEQWYNSYIEATDFRNNETNPDFDHNKWEEQGLQFARLLRQQLPEDIDLWYESPFGNDKKTTKLIYKDYITL